MVLARWKLTKPFQVPVELQIYLSKLECIYYQSGVCKTQRHVQSIWILEIVLSFMEITQRLILRLKVKEMLSSYSEVIFIALMTMISTCFLNGQNSEHETYSKADYVRGTKLLFRSRLHSLLNSNQHFQRVKMISIQETN